ncbi:heavy metal translocating P-type ATPase [Deinococcus sp. LM3]|uniref:heavy metal translocating P-type ATPase n=3 Tax=unclassified Deinococcus TaxID=2623546 RepID=UPI000993F899|nr:heavy metal translocating P-type ATPase [Deinococcus sp. LM3]OOV12805.1 ATPase [Deinococcus sp. LM3]
MTTRPLPELPAAPVLTYRVEGMDCAHCVQKVERLVGTLPGTAAVSTSFTRQTLRLELDEALTPRQTLERHLRALGYVPALQSGPGAAKPPATPLDTPPHEPQAGTARHAAGATAWYRSAQGRLVLLSGTLLAAAWLLSLAAPQAAELGFVAVTLLAGAPLARRAVISARLGEVFSINLLVTLAALGALLIGEAAEGAAVVFLFAVGELLEGVAAGRARSGVQALAALTPSTAQLLTPQGVQEVPAASLRPGQRVLVTPGTRVPADGVIEEGVSGLDDSAVTGESVPVRRAAGDEVFGGSVSTDGTLTVRVTREANDTTLARILHLIEQAEESRAPTARFIDRFSRVYTPGVVLVSALVAFGPPLLGEPLSPWLYKGLSLLLIGCPCALVLSVPAAVTSGLSAGARRGLLIKGGAALETLARVRTVAFDKTGTLTAGHPRLSECLPAGPDCGPTNPDGGHADPDRVTLGLAAAVAGASSHPLSRAVTDAARARGLSVPAVTDAHARPGEGASATLNGRALHLSSAPSAAGRLGGAMTAELGKLEALEARGLSVSVLHDDHAPLALLAFQDDLRPDAAPALADLRRLGVGAVMLTGDHERAAQAAARDLPTIDVHASLRPGEKLRHLEALPGPVVMVGDGINDAPALARADVGIAMGGGTDVALDTADAALLGSSLRGVPDMVQLARATMRNIHWNIALALGLKGLFLITTLTGATTLWMAVLADTGATALVTANALRLLRWTPERP